MRTKILMVAASLAVMLAMTGIAAADQMNIYKGSEEVTSVTIPVGGSTDLTINVSSFINKLGTIHNMSVALFEADESTPATGLDVTITETVPPLGPSPGPNTCTFPGTAPCDPLVRWKQSMGKGGSEVLNLTIADAALVPHNYFLEITDNKSGKKVKASLSTASIAVSVPEFATIAAPVGAVMGLVFLLYQRKRKEE